MADTITLPRDVVNRVHKALGVALDASFSIQDGIYAGQSETSEDEAKRIAVRAVLRDLDEAAQPARDAIDDLLKRTETP